MKTMKKFLIYAILVIVVIVSTDFLASLCLQTTYHDITNYQIATNSPVIKIEEARTNNANGTIKGTITNETDTLMQDLFVKIELLSSSGNRLGTEYLQAGNMQPGQSKEFELNYRYSKVDHFIISTTHEVVQEEIQYHPLIEHARFYFGIAKFIVFVTLPPFYLLSAFI